MYETPGGTILLMAHRGIESICLDRGESHMKVRDDGLVLDFSQELHDWIQHWFRSGRRKVAQRLKGRNIYNFTTSPPPSPQDDLMPKYAELIYNGFWFSPEREALQTLIDKTQEYCTGKPWAVGLITLTI